MASLVLRSDRLRRWVAVAAFCLAAVAANSLGLQLFYGTELFFGSAVVILALLLLGNRAVVVGLAACGLVPRLWGEPMSLLIALMELLWLKLCLDYVIDRGSRRDKGWIVLADILFWVLLGVPLAFLLFGVVLNLDPAAVLNLAIRQGVNGSLNAIVAFVLYSVIRLAQARRDPGRAMAIHGVLLITLLSAMVLPSLVVLTLSTRHLNAGTLEVYLRRMRQMAQLSVSVRPELLSEFDAGLRRMGALLEFRLLDEKGAVLYSSNPGLFRTLDSSYRPIPRGQLGFPALPLHLELLVPREALSSPRSVLRGYLWTSLTAGEIAELDPPPLRPGLQVQVVQPARPRMRELEAQSAEALGTLGWIVLIAACLAKAGAKALRDQVPRWSPAGQEASGSLQSGHSLLLELDQLRLALQGSETRRLSLSQELDRNEQQRMALQREVNSLNILDPLTGCFNRHELQRRLDHELRRSKRDRGELSFLCLEIDHLRQIKESYGCPAAEQVLRLVASEICRRSRTTDCVCRFADDRFALLLPACSRDSAQVLADLFCSAVAAMEMEHQGCRLSVTLSVGITSLRSENDDADTLINRADNALYRAKIEGRNRVVVL